jgi:hypothetical protein
VSSDSGVSTSPRQLTFTRTRAKTRWLRLELTPIGEVCDSGIYFGAAIFRNRFLLNQRSRNLRSKQWYGTGVTSELSRIGKHSFLPQRNSQSAAGIEGVAEPAPDGFFAIPVNVRIGISGSRPQDAVIYRILFISLSEDGQLKDVLTALDKTSVLTVSDIPDFSQRGGMIEFVLVGTRIRFEVNLTTTQHAGLTVSSELLKVAITVRRDSQPGD